MKLASPAKLQRDGEFSQAVLIKNNTWRTVSYKDPGGGGGGGEGREFYRVLRGGFAVEKLKFFF